MKTLPPFLTDMLAAPPSAGAGVHAWLFSVARNLHPHMPAPEIMALLKERTRQCGRTMPDREIQEAVRDSMACAWQPRMDGAPAGVAAPKWPALDMELREAIISDGVGVADLWEFSNPRLEDNRNRTEEVIDWLFPDNPWLCCGASTSCFDTRRRDDWRGHLHQGQLIVPNPMTAKTGTTKAGCPSKHCLDNTGPRRFLVVEFDAGTLDEQAGILLHLSAYAPLVCVVHSGNRSLHGWFYVKGQPEAKVRDFFRYSASLGADAVTWTRSQFVRMPDGQRDNGRRQRVHFLNLKPLEQKYEHTKRNRRHH